MTGPGSSIGTVITAQQILDALNAARVRATYGAVGEVLRIHPLSVAKHLGARRPEASWVVSARTGLPSGYSSSDTHGDLLNNTQIIRTGDELKQLLTKSSPEIETQATSKTVRLVGIDLAWNCEKNGTGIAIGRLEGRQLIVESVQSKTFSLDEIARLVTDAPDIRGIAIDAPLIINNASGSRPCERALNAVYQRFWAGAHPTNLKTPWRSGVELSNRLEPLGYSHLGPSDDRWQIECYPHPAIVEIFGLEKRLKYKRKKGMTAGDMRDGQVQLANHIGSLSSAQTLSLRCTDEVQAKIGEMAARETPDRLLKNNEDLLDAVVCLYICGLYAVGATSRVFGDTQSGYIFVPTFS